MLFKQILTRGCVIYTVIITAYYSMGCIAGLEDWVPTPRIFFSLLGFSMVFSALCALTAKLRLGNALKTGIHFFASALLFYLFFVLGGGFGKNVSTTVTAMLTFVLIYAVCKGIAYALRRISQNKTAADPKAKNNPKKDDYKSIFDR